ncbi:MAG: glutamine synthetase [Actinomycetes bacterium]
MDESRGLDGLRTRLAGQGVAGIALCYVDTSGITRVKGIPVARLDHAVDPGIGMSPVFDVFLLDDSITAGRYAGGPVGDLRLVPDLDRLVPLAGQPGWAFAPVDRWRQDGERHPICSRWFARRMADALAAVGFSARMAFEVEWYVDRGTGDVLEPACVGPAYGMTRLVELSEYTRDVLAALAAEGIAVEQLHPEYAPGQLEVSVASEDPVGAADTAVLVRHTIRAVSARHALRVSFAPSVVCGGVGNGGHVHLSLWRDGRNVTADPGRSLTPSGAAFAAGVLEELPALLAIGAPSVASYLRLVPQHWAGAFRCWGWENREAAVRVVLDRSPNFEVKCVDQSANPYLLVGALLAAGMAGLAKGATLPPPVDVDPALLAPQERARLGVERLPESLEQSLAAFDASQVLHEALGEPLADTIATVRRAELDLFAGSSADDVLARTRWRH